MPFTPSHAVVALPFVRTPLVPAAIAVGAMTPDLPLFVRGTLFDYAVSHSFVWMPVTVMVALVLLLVWRCVLRPAATELAPRWLAARLPRAWDAGAARGAHETFARRGSTVVSTGGVALLVVSLALGAASHIAWDLFTHEGRWGTVILPVLDRPWGPFTGYKWLQHGSSAAGLGVLGVWGILWLRRAPARRVARIVPDAVRLLWWASLPAALLAAAIGGYVALGPFSPEFTPAHLGYAVLPPACAAWGVVTVVLCLLVQRARGRVASP
ncbi:DUF4184 family protein [Microbacterium sp. SORGH_AS_0888]|uniref:DUF4184 family protein n=1 Tax=Microbacterium sp. SORGH_AS_0888 TaxID=3041791 RepID=UPI002783A5AA|nr:DUF4184 family protein [Microbacterium sp. SORGH_AS_0888]MDQ1129030.1 hypothetical protein [Microbacterium sp. SORGH_AS_0888]